MIVASNILRNISTFSNKCLKLKNCLALTAIYLCMLRAEEAYRRRLTVNKEALAKTNEQTLFKPLRIFVSLRFCAKRNF